MLLHRDHPRVCGKNIRVSCSDATSLGSHPRVREKQSVICSRISEHRITPACAGKTIGSWDSKRFSQDHTRVCGKNLKIERKISKILGSPPRVREKLELTKDLDYESGITPACAGKTDHLIWRNTSDGDHPRVCGKNQLGLRPIRVLGGITPACAGKTNTTKLDLMDGMGSHPRVREKLIRKHR